MGDHLPLSLVKDPLRPALEQGLATNYRLTTALVSSILREVTQTLGPDCQSNEYLDQPPANVDDFLNFCQRAFSPAFCDCLTVRIREFSKLVDDTEEEGLADTFIRERSRRGWVENIVLNIQITYNSSNNPPLPATQQRLDVTPLASDFDHFGLDGNGDTSVPVVEQIVLDGSNLKRAWAENPTTRTWRPPVQSFSPAEHGAPLVYHGTMAGNVRSAEVGDLVNGRVGLGGNVNQMAPWGVFHTSFHGVRSFLWGVFNAGVATATLDSHLIECLNQSTLTVNGNTFSGVLIVQFSTSTPGPPLLHSEILDEQSIPAFSQHCLASFKGQQRSPDVKNQLWKDMAFLHHKESNHWPDVLHAPEVPAMQHALSEFNSRHNEGLLPGAGSLWRSAHCSDAAVDDLSHHFIKSYVVSIKNEPLLQVVTNVATMGKPPSDSSGKSRDFLKKTI